MEARPHVLVANEPLVYRDVLTTELLRLRPQLRILRVDPTHLEWAVERLRPQLVICSRLTASIRRHATAHIVLYPEGENRAVLEVAGERQVLPDPHLADLLERVDAVVGNGEPGGETNSDPDP